MQLKEETQDYVIKKLEYTELEAVYNQYLHRHFPADEIKPLAHIRRMWEAGAYQALAMYGRQGEQELMGYGFFAADTESSMLLLDYFAILEKYRARGLGSIFLKEMHRLLKDYNGILIETEDADYAANETELMIRRKRDAFYEGNGVLKTGIVSEVYGVHYQIWQFPGEKPASVKECRDNLEKIYRFMIPGEKYERHVKIMI